MGYGPKFDGLFDDCALLFFIILFLLLFYRPNWGYGFGRDFAVKE